jgi:hypothetical protein
MNSSSQYSTLTRLLALNNRVHDLKNHLLGVAVPDGRYKPMVTVPGPMPSAIAELQEKIDQGVRASLATCWLGMPGELEE